MAKTQAEIELLINSAGAGNSIRELSMRSRELQKALSEATDPAVVARLNKAFLENRDAMIDARQEVAALTGNMVERFATVGSRITDSFAVATGAIALFGEEGSKLQEVAEKASAIFSVLSGFGGLQDTIALVQRYVGTLFGVSTAQEAMAVSTGAATVATEANTVATTAGTVATTAFGTALKALGIGLVISALALLVDQWDNITKAVGKATGGVDNLSQVMSGVGSAAVEVGKTILSGLAAPVKILYNLITGDLKGAWNVVKETTNSIVNIGDTVTKAYQSGKLETAQKQSLDKQISQLQVANTRLAEGSLKRLENEKQILKLQLSQAEEGSKEYLEIQDKLTQKEQSILKKREEMRKQESEKAYNTRVKEIEREQEAFDKAFGEKGMQKIASKPITPAVKLEPDFSTFEATKNSIGSAIDKINSDIANEKAYTTSEKEEMIKKLFPFLSPEEIQKVAKLSGEKLEKELEKQANRLRNIQESLGALGIGQNLAKAITDGFQSVNLEDVFKDALSFIQDIASQISSIRLMELENEKNDELTMIEKQEEDRLRTVEKGSQQEARIKEQFSKKKEKVDQEYAKKEREVRKNAALFESDIRIAMIIADTAKGVAAALPNLVLAGIVGVIGGIQLSLATQQRSAIASAKAEKGGMVLGNGHANNGVKLLQGGGMTGIEVEGGEFIVNRRATEMFMPELKAINNGTMENTMSSKLDIIASQLQKLNANPARAYIVSSDIEQANEKNDFLKKRTQI